jgi:hypothetical protein
VGTIRMWKCSVPTDYGKAQDFRRTVYVQCSCGEKWLGEEVPGDYRSLEYAKELTSSHCGASHQEKRGPFSPLTTDRTTTALQSTNAAD